MSNKFRFKIIELTQNNELNITELSSKLGLAYTKTSNYVTLLSKSNLVYKTKDGREIKVKSKVKLNKTKIEF